MGKVPADLEVEEELLLQARAEGVDVSATLDEALRRELRARAAAKAWAEENAEAIADYNRRIAERGVFGEDLRRW